MPRLQHLVLLLALGLAGCPKSSASSGDEKASKADDDSKKKSKKAADDDDDDKPAKKKKKKTADDDDDSKKADDKGDDDKAAAKKADDDDKGAKKAADKGAAPEAANASDVKRYPDEKKIDPPTKKKTLAANYAVRVDSVGTSKAVAALPKDAEVTQIAERSGHYLVTFANPKNPSETLMGWIFKAAFEAAPEKGAAAGKGCPPGQVLYDSPATGSFCAKKCTATANCNKGDVCWEGACIPASE